MSKNTPSIFWRRGDNFLKRLGGSYGKFVKGQLRELIWGKHSIISSGGGK